jgi:hypothetical protein
MEETFEFTVRVFIDLHPLKALSTIEVVDWSILKSPRQHWFGLVVKV